MGGNSGALGDRVRRRGWTAVVWLVWLGLAVPGWAQGPQVEIGEPPGVAGPSAKFSASPGALSQSAFDNLENARRPIGGRPGPSVSRAPVGIARPEGRAVSLETQLPRPRVLEPVPVPAYGDLAEPSGPEDMGPPDGLTLDEAINRLIERNLDLIALQYEIPMAQADVLTASLRANPIFYADSQLVPYGRFSNAKPGGQTQYDVNVTYPLDVTGKRRARTEAARQAKKVTEAQLQDAVRLQVDNLYTSFVDVIAAEETTRYSEANAQALTKLYRLNLRLSQEGATTPDRTDVVRAQLERSQLQVREAGESLVTATRVLALLLNVPAAEADSLRLRGALRDVNPLPVPAPELVAKGMVERPDLQAMRLGIGRARAEVDLAKANRYSDVYLLYQPYTYQDNRPWGLKSATSYAIGVTATLPLYNRNQGNVERARYNYRQTTVELAALERRVRFEIESAVREFSLSLTYVEEIEREVLPAQRRVLERAARQFQEGAVSPADFFEAQREYNEVVRHYRDSLVRHRRSVLDLNTAVGSRLLP